MKVKVWHILLFLVLIITLEFTLIGMYKPTAEDTLRVCHHNATSQECKDDQQQSNSEYLCKDGKCWLEVQ